MRLADILDPACVVPDVAATTKAEALLELARAVCRACGEIPVGADAVLGALLAREAMGSTGVGEGIAIPHAKVAGLPRLVACLGRARASIDFDAIDQQPVRLVFLLLIPAGSGGTHLRALARISRLLKDPTLRERLLAAEGPGIHPALVDADGRR